MAAALLSLVLAAPARADVPLVGDSGPRSLTIDSAQLVTSFFSTAGIVGSAPIPITVAGDGTFSIPASALSVQGTAVVPQQVLGQVVAGCETFTASTDGFSQNVSLGASSDPAGLVNPALGTAHLGVDGAVTASDVTMPVALDGAGCIGDSHQTGTLSCSFASVPVHLDLDGDAAHGTDLASGILALSDQSVSTPLTPVCSGGGALGPYLSLATDFLTSLYGGITGTLNAGATMTPGVHSPLAPHFASAPTLTGSPTVGSPLTCTPAALVGVPDPVVTFSWLLGGLPLPDAVGSTYTVQPSDAAHAITCAVTAINPFGVAGLSSNVVTIANAAPGTTSTGGPGGPGGSGSTAPTTPTTAKQPAKAAGCKVPKLKGLTLKKAKRKLKKAHCRAGKVKKIKAKAKGKAKAVKKGHVVKTKPAAGKRKKAGTRVKLYVAR